MGMREGASYTLTDRKPLNALSGGPIMGEGFEGTAKACNVVCSLI